LPVSWKKILARSFHHNPEDIWFDINLVSRDQYALKANWPVPLITLNAASCLKPNYAGDACLYKSFLFLSADLKAAFDSWVAFMLF